MIARFILFMTITRVVFAQLAFSNEAIVYIKKEDPFEYGKIHPFAGVEMQVIDAGFGSVSDIRCTKSARKTGVARCKFVSEDCIKEEGEENSYLIQLEQEIFGFLLNKNVFDVSVKGCDLIPPSEFSFTYKTKSYDIFAASKANLSSQIRLLNEAQIFSSISWDSEAELVEVKSVVKTFDSSQVLRSLIDSNNLAVMYAKIAGSYEEDSADYKKYLGVAKSFEKLSALLANQELFNSVDKIQVGSPNQIEVSPDLGAYIQNVERIRKARVSLFAECPALQCDVNKLEEGVDLVLLNERLDNKTVFGLRKISESMKVIRN